MKIKYLSQDKYCDEYMRYLGIAKTERRSYAESVRLLKAKGFKDISSFKSLKPGDKVYRGYEDRTVMAAVIGKKPISAVGLKVVGGHTDAPRLDLKPKPLYEKGGCVYFDCHIYGGIKKYQWLTLPLALYGTIVRTDGTKVQVAVGDNPGDPVFMISDILPHLSKDQAEKKRDEFFPAEDLDPVCWSTPEAKAKDECEGSCKADRKGLAEIRFGAGLARVGLRGVGRGDDVEILGREELLLGLLLLVLAEVREDVGDHEDGIAGPVADGDVDLRAVLAHDHAVEGERQGEPLVLLDAAVHVGVEVDDAVLGVDGPGLEVEPRGVGVAADDADALRGGRLADDHGHEGLAVVAAPNLVAGAELLHGGDLLEPGLGDELDRGGVGAAFGLGFREEVHVFTAVAFDGFLVHWG